MTKNLVIHRGEDQRAENAWPYIHIILQKETVIRVKALAVESGYKLGALCDILLTYAMDNAKLEGRK